MARYGTGLHHAPLRTPAKKDVTAKKQGGEGMGRTHEPGVIKPVTLPARGGYFGMELKRRGLRNTQFG